MEAKEKHNNRHDSISKLVASLEEPLRAEHCLFSVMRSRDLKSEPGEHGRELDT